MQDVEAEYEGTVRFALDLINLVNGSNGFGFKPLSLSDFTIYEFQLMNYFQTQLSKHRAALKKN